MGSLSQNQKTRARNSQGRFVPSPDTAERDAAASRLRAEGRAYREIAERLGFADPSGARRAVERGLDAIRAEGAEALRELELHRLDQLHQRAWSELTRDDEDSQPLQAIDRLLKIQERRARLLGLDARDTTQAAVTVNVAGGVPVDTVLARVVAAVRPWPAAADAVAQVLAELAREAKESK